VIAGILSKPHPFEDGAFLLCTGLSGSFESVPFGAIGVSGTYQSQ
jgi:hypothetical protein